MSAFPQGIHRYDIEGLTIFTNWRDVDFDVITNVYDANDRLAVATEPHDTFELLLEDSQKRVADGECACGSEKPDGE